MNLEHEDKLYEALEQASELFQQDKEELLKRLTVTMQHDHTHGAMYTNFIVVYADPELGEMVKHIDSMTWENVGEILKEGANAQGILDYLNQRVFHHQVFLKDENGEWSDDTDGDGIGFHMEEMASVYNSNSFKLERFIPDWKEQVYQAVKEFYKGREAEFE